jgi:3-isopropylmalate dehydratase small subunit
MEPFTTLTAAAIPIDQPNLDTDQIIPAPFFSASRATCRWRPFSTISVTTGGTTQA